MSLALFDLDNTLIAGDSDHSWGEFLVENDLVDAAAYRARNDAFYHAYQRGELDIRAYLAFALEPLTRFSRAELEALHRRFMAQKIEPLQLPKAAQLLAQHKAAGDTVLIITSTNRFITQPIAERLGADALLATELEETAGRYTGNILHEPCYREGKIAHLERWLAQTGASLAGSAFYSDSINDLPLLERVDKPVAVDPDPQLRAEAATRGWSITSLRE